MIPLFTLAPKDQSIGYLSQIFGTVSGVLANSVNPSAGPITLLSTMFKTFNSVILVVAVLMLVYITIIGVIATAHDGEFMGKKMNNIWIPIRAIMGIALLVPTGPGYCAIQIVMMWIIVQGVAAADGLWNTALVYVSVTSPYSSISVTGAQTNQVLSGLFQGIACQTSLGNKVPDFTAASNCPNGKCSYSLGDCGSLTYCDTSSSCSEINAGATTSPQCLVCRAQVDALTASINQLFVPIAQYFVNADKSYQDFYANSATTPNKAGWGWIRNYCSSANINPEACCVNNAPFAFANQACQATPGNMPALYDSSTSPLDKKSASSDAVQKVYWKFWPELAPSLGLGSDFISVASAQYTEMATEAMTNYLQSQTASLDSNGLLKDASNNGWIYAGGLYYTIASSNNDTLKGSIPVLAWNAPDANSGVLKNARNNYTAASYLSNAAAGNYATNATSAQYQSTLNSINSVPGDVSKLFSDNVSNKGGNPLVALVGVGQALLIVADIVFFVILELVTSMGIALGFGSLEVLGTGFPALPAIFNFIEVALIPLVYGALALLVALGATLAIYTPLLPFIYFTFGAIAWMISVIEAMVAGPLVALFIINPKGEHEIMGSAGQALMLIFNIFLRPSLMIFGLMAAMLLATVVVTFINATFAYVFTSGAISNKDPISLILVLVAYVGLILAGLNRSFQVINLVPQQVMRWIGHQAEGVEAPTEEMKGKIEGGAGRIGGAAPQGMSEQSAEQRRDRMKAAETQATLKAKGGDKENK